MPLTRAQTKLYHHVVDIWRRGLAAVEFGEDGEPLSAVYHRAHANVPCYFETGKGMSVPKEGVGRVDYDIVITSDQVHFGVEVDIQNSDVMLFTHPGNDPKAGMCWIVQGEPQRVGRVGRRYSGKKTVTAARAPGPIEGIN